MSRVFGQIGKKYLIGRINELQKLVVKIEKVFGKKIKTKLKLHWISYA